MEWIVDVNVGAGTRIGCIQLFVHGASITAVEGSVHSFFLDYFVLHVILLSFVFILAWARVLSECLPSVRCLSFVFPELAPLSL